MRQESEKSMVEFVNKSDDKLPNSSESPSLEVHTKKKSNINIGNNDNDNISNNSNLPEAGSIGAIDLAADTSEDEMPGLRPSVSRRSGAAINVEDVSKRSFSKRFKIVFSEKVHVRKRFILVFIKFIASFFGVFGLPFFGALCMYYIQRDDVNGLTFALSFNWACATLTTVGYGDVTPQTDQMKIFAIFYMFFGLLFFTFCLGTMVSALYEMHIMLFPKTHTLKGGKLSFSREYKKVLLQIVGCIVFLVSIIVVGVVYYSIVENLSTLNSVYWALETCTSVGYGDILNHFNVKKGTVWFAGFYMLIGASFFLSTVGYFCSRIVVLNMISKLDYISKEGLSNDMIERMDQDGDCSIDKEEFLRYMLIEMGFCGESDIHFIDNLFSKYDKDGNGVLDMEDIILGVQKKRELENKSKMNILQRRLYKSNAH